MNPSAARRLLNAASMRALLEKLLRKPINGTGGCCARVQTGIIAAVLPRITMNSRRLIGLVFGAATRDSFLRMNYLCPLWRIVGGRRLQLFLWCRTRICKHARALIRALERWEISASLGKDI